QEEEGAEPSNAREQGTLDGLGGEEPGLSGRGELAQHGRAKQEAGGEFTDHRGLANPPQECPEHARCEEQHEELKPKDEELMLCQHAEGTPPGFVRRGRNVSRGRRRCSALCAGFLICRRPAKHHASDRFGLGGGARSKYHVVARRLRTRGIGGGRVSQESEGLATAASEVAPAFRARAARFRHPGLPAKGAHSRRVRPAGTKSALVCAPEGQARELGGSVTRQNDT